MPKSSHMQTLLERKNLTVLQFKKKYPRLYAEIIRYYGGKSNVFDVSAAIELWAQSVAHPACNICSKPVTITKKFRKGPVAPIRCAKHTNTNLLLAAADLRIVLPDNVEITGPLPQQFSPSTEVVLHCAQHGEYRQQASFILKGGQCQRCYHENKGVRISAEQWIDESSAKHNGFYDYSLANFTSVANEVTILCPVHGEFVQNAGVHMRGHGCKKCANNAASFTQRIILEEFVNKCGTEYEIIDFLRNNGVSNIVHSDQSLGIELDIYLPDHKVAIEYNGVYWHSSGNRETDSKRSQQHLRKTGICEKNGIMLIHMLDLEWNNPLQRNIWQSTLLHKLGMSKNRIYARQCKLVQVSNSAANQFFAENHLQGNARSSVRIGLEYNNQLVAVGSFAKSRFNKNYDYELIRFASACGTSVVGGFQRIIKAFVKTHNGKLISYANKRWSQGAVYETNGFTQVSKTAPGYYYTNCKTLWHRTVFQRHKLADLLDDYNSELSEVDNMYKNGYRRIWDCGQLVYEYKQ